MRSRFTILTFIAAVRLHAGPEAATPAPPEARGPLDLKKEQFAAPPQVQHPIALDVDAQGRVFVSETYRYEKHGIIDNRGNPKRELADLQTTTLEDRERFLKEWLASGELDKDIEARKPRFSDAGDGRGTYLTKYSEKVACLVDANRDLRADQRHEFSSGYNQILDGPAAGILTWDGKVWLTCIPHLWALEDKDKDLIADSKVSLARGFGVRTGWFGHDLHGLTMGPEGKLYFSMGDRGFNLRTKEGRILHGPFTGGVFRCWPDGKELELVAQGLRNPQDLAFDDFGNLFTGDNNCDAGDKARIEFIVDGAHFGWEVSYQDLESRGPWMREKMWQLRPAKTDPTYPAWIIPPVGHLAAGPSGLVAYPGTGLPESYRGHFFLCDFRGGDGSIHAFLPEPEGAGFKLKQVHEIQKGFGVVDLAFGYDGRMYVADWGNAWVPNDASRIWTLTHEPSQQSPIVAEVQKLASEGMAQRSILELRKLLDHPDRRIRLLSQQALAQKPVPEVLEKLVSTVRKGTSPMAQLHALWALGSMAHRNPALLTELTQFLQLQQSVIRAQTARILGEGGHQPAVPLLIKLLEDPDAHVRLRAGLALSRLADRSAVPALLKFAEANDDNDALLRHAAVMGLASCALSTDLASSTRAHPSRAVRLAAVLALRRTSSQELSNFLIDDDPQIVTEAARAIYDQTILPAFAALSATLDREKIPTELQHEGYLRRAIEATYQLGGAEHAQRLAKLAALPLSSGLPQPFRLLALEKLESWDSPPQREAVWGRYHLLPSRPAGLARAAIRAHIPALAKFASGEVLAKARALELKFGGEKSPAAMAALIKDVTQPESLRLDYLGVLGAGGAATAPAHEEVCKTILATPSEPAALRAAARASQAKRHPATALALVQDALLLGQPAEKQAAVGLLLKLRTNESEKKLQELGQELVAGSLHPAIRVEVLEGILHRDEKRTPWRRILERYGEHLEQAHDPLAEHRVALEGGNAELGHALFRNHQTAQCLRCHAVAGQGGTVGPDLKGVASRGNLDFLLESLVNPSAKVAPGFGIVTVTRKAGGTPISGVLQAQNAESIDILVGTTPRQIPMTEIESLSKPLSTMPPMAALLSKRELRDLIAYLQTLK